MANPYHDDKGKFTSGSGGGGGNARFQREYGRKARGEKPLSREYVSTAKLMAQGATVPKPMLARMASEIGISQRELVGHLRADAKSYSRTSDARGKDRSSSRKHRIK